MVEARAQYKTIRRLRLWCRWFNSTLPHNKNEREAIKIKLEDAIRANPYKKEKGSIGAYIRYLRYTVDGWYTRKSKDIREQLDWDEITKER